MPTTVWTVYKTTHRPSGKFYIGVHKTADPNDRYLGSGKVITRAIRAHGRQEFSKEVLFVFANPAEAYAKEAELVNDAFVARVDTYNLARGGAIIKHGREGEANSQHGTFWVSREGEPSQKVHKNQLQSLLEAGWTRGRTSPQKRLERQQARAQQAREGKEKQRQHLRDLNLRRNPQRTGHAGLIYVNRDGEVRRVDPKELELLLSLGWAEGRCPRPSRPVRVRATQEEDGTKLDWDKVAEIRTRYATRRFSQAALAREFCVSQVLISLIVNHKIWIDNRVSRGGDQP